MLSVFKSVAEWARFRYVKGMSRMSELTSMPCLSLLVQHCWSAMCCCVIDDVGTDILKRLQVQHKYCFRDKVRIFNFFSSTNESDPQLSIVDRHCIAWVALLRIWSKCTRFFLFCPIQVSLQAWKWSICSTLEVSSMISIRSQLLRVLWPFGCTRCSLP